MGISGGKEEHRETEASTKALELEAKFNETYEMHMQRAAQATKMSQIIKEQSELSVFVHIRINLKYLCSF